MTTENLNNEARIGLSLLNAGLGTVIIAWWRERRRKQNILRLQKRLWAANYIVMSERHGFHSKENKEFHTELESCSDQLGLTICKLKKHINVPNGEINGRAEGASQRGTSDVE